jgi:hypothetical protein
MMLYWRGRDYELLDNIYKSAIDKTIDNRRLKQFNNILQTGVTQEV